MAGFFCIGKKSNQEDLTFPLLEAPYLMQM